MKQILAFILALGLPQGITLLATMLAVHTLSDEEYVVFIAWISACMFVAASVSAVSNRLLIAGGVDQGLYKVEIVLICALCPISLLIFDVGRIGWVGVFVVTSLICVYERIRSFYQKGLQSKKFLQISIFRSLSYGMAALVISYVYSGNVTAVLWIACFVGSYIFAVCVAFVGYRRSFANARKKITDAPVLMILRGAVPMLTYVFLLPGVSLLPIAFINRLSGGAESKLWVVAFSLYSIANVVVSGLKKFLFAKYSSSSNEILDWRRGAAIIYNTTAGLLVVCVLLIFLVWFFIEQVGGVDRFDVVKVTTVMFFSSVVSSLFSPHSQRFQSYNLYKHLNFSLVLLVIVLVGTMSFSVPRWGALGAAFSFALSYSVQNIYIYYKARLEFS